MSFSSSSQKQIKVAETETKARTQQGVFQLRDRQCFLQQSGLGIYCELHVEYIFHKAPAIQNPFPGVQEHNIPTMLSLTLPLY
jgi:hypothetical protein